MAVALITYTGRLKRKLAASLKTEDVAEITDLIEEISAGFERDCQQPIASREIEYAFSGSGLPRHTLPFRPVTEISKLEYYQSPTEDWIEIPAEQYKLVTKGIAFVIDYPGGFSEPQRFRRFDGGLLPALPSSGVSAWASIAGSGNYRATITVGYAEIPADIQGVIRDEVIAKWYEGPGAGRDRFDVKSVAVSEAGAYQGKTLTLDSTDRRAAYDRAVARYRSFD